MDDVHLLHGLLVFTKPRTWRYTRNQARMTEAEYVRLCAFPCARNIIRPTVERTNDIGIIHVQTDSRYAINLIFSMTQLDLYHLDKKYTARLSYNYEDNASKITKCSNKINSP